MFNIIIFKFFKFVIFKFFKIIKINSSIKNLIYLIFKNCKLKNCVDLITKFLNNISNIFFCKKSIRKPSLKKLKLFLLNKFILLNLYILQKNNLKISNKKWFKKIIM